MTDFRMRVAGLDVEIRSIHDQIRRLCADYLIDPTGPGSAGQAPDITIATTQADIDHERETGEPGDWTDDYLETIAVLRKLAEAAPLHRRFLFHGATIEFDGRAYIFTAPSGTGKSTHIALWHRVFGKKVRIINGDKPFLSVEDGRVTAYGTPWSGKEGWQRNVSAPLAGICLITRADQSASPTGPDDQVLPAVPAAATVPLHDPSDPVPTRQTPDGTAFLDDDGIPNTCVRLTASDALPSLIYRQIYIPQDPAAAAASLDLLDGLLTTVPIYRLTCTVSEAAVLASSTALLP